MFFNIWLGLLRVVMIGALAYVALVAILRLSGKRTLSKMNAFDLVVAVALGSTLATVLLSKDVALAEGAMAFALLAFLQFSVTWLSMRSRTISELVRSQPKLHFYRGRFLRDEMKAERVAEEAVRQAIRAQGRRTSKKWKRWRSKRTGALASSPNLKGPVIPLSAAWAITQGVRRE
jgi:uncharacterized membrane protein YcaP (DUF421 family)